MLCQFLLVHWIVPINFDIVVVANSVLISCLAIQQPAAQWWLKNNNKTRIKKKKCWPTKTYSFLEWLWLCLFKFLLFKLFNFFNICQILNFNLVGLVKCKIVKFLLAKLCLAAIFKFNKGKTVCVLS